MLGVLLDTNVASSLIREPSSSLLVALASRRVCVSVITEAELRFGVARKPSATRLAQLVDSFLESVEVLPWTSQTAQLYARLRANLERSGIGLSSLDLLIAAQSLEAGLELATRDRAFERVPGLALLEWDQA